MIAATNPDVTGMTVGYALGAVTVGMALAGLLLYAAWTTRDGRRGRVERWLDSRLARRAARALDRGDQQILRAVQESEDAYRRRPQQHASVPRQLERNHR